MRKKARTLVILAVVLVLCIGAYIAVTVYNNAQARKAADEAKAKVLWPDGRGAPVAISYTTEDKTLSFVREDGTWKVADNKDFPLTQASLTGLASALEHLTAVRTFDAASDLSAYGLDKPKYTVTADDSEGRVLTLRIGSETNGDYYAMTQDGGKIHTISSSVVDNLKPDYLGMITLDTLPSFSSTSIETLTVTDGTASLTLSQHKNKDDTYTWFVVRGDAVTAADEITVDASVGKTPEKLIDAAAKAVSYIRFTSCAAYKPDDAELKTFGLDTPRLTVRADYTVTTGTGLEKKTTKETMRLEIGAPLPDGGGYYARLPGSSQINVLATEKVEPLADALAALGQS